MAYSWINQRLIDLESHIDKDMELMNEFEEELRYETNPRIKAQYRKEIERQKQSISKYKQEYKEIQQELCARKIDINVQNIDRKLQQMDSKLNLLVSGQVTIYNDLNQMQQKLLERYDESEKFIVAEIIKELNDNQLALTQDLLKAVETNQIPETEIQEMIAILEEQIPALPQNQKNSVGDIIKSPELDAKHKLIVTLPIIPFLIQYKGELELGAGVDIKLAWEKLKSKLKRNQ